MASCAESFRRSRCMKTLNCVTQNNNLSLILLFTPSNKIYLFFMHCWPLISLCTQSSRRFGSMFEQRRKLPAWQEKENILGLLDRCQVLVVSGMTGWVTQGSRKC